MKKERICKQKNKKFKKTQNCINAKFLQINLDSE